MQVHVVRIGESLYSIANKYSVKMDEIILTNKLEEPVRLVEGQVLVIPIKGEYYFVRRGDSLESIADRYNLTALELARINQFPIDDPLPLGLRLYIPSNLN